MDSAPVASVAARAPVHIERSTCVSASRENVLAVLRVELPGQLVDDAPPGGAYEVAVDCSRAGVALSIAAPGGARKTYRMDLSGAPLGVRPRIVALTIAEIVRDFDYEPPQEPSAPPSPPPAADTATREAVPPAPDVSSSAPPRNGPVLLSLLGEAATFRLDGRWLLGGGLRFEYARKWLSAGIDAVFLTADEGVSLGTARVLLPYASPYIGLGTGNGRLLARIGGGCAFGAASVSGHATDPGARAATISGAWIAPYAFAQLGLVATDVLRIDLRGQLGWVAAPVVGTVEGGADVDLGGLWTSMQLAAAFSL
jgi:hypothetical protein